MKYRNKPVQLTNDIHSQLKDYCLSTGRKMSEAAEEAITNFLKNQNILDQARRQALSKTMLEIQMKEYIKQISNEG